MTTVHDISKWQNKYYVEHEVIAGTLSQKHFMEISQNTLSHWVCKQWVLYCLNFQLFLVILFVIVEL